MDIKEFAKKVADMRMAQNAFFEAKKKAQVLQSTHWLRIAREWEREVDDLCKQLAAGPDLFNGA